METENNAVNYDDCTPSSNGHHNFKARCLYCGIEDKRQKTTRVFIAADFYWGAGATIKEARHEYRKVSGKFPPKEARFIIVHGTRAAEAGIDDMGGINYYPTDTILYV